VSETTKTDDTDLFRSTLFENITVKRRKGGNSCTEEGSSILQRNAIGQMKDKVLVDNNIGRITTICMASSALLEVLSLVLGKGSGEGLHDMRTVLFKALFAEITTATTLDPASNANAVPGFEFRHVTTNLPYKSRDLVSRGNGKAFQAPLTIAGMKI
jgi:hypothetical protein